jgi:hypothetical protein
MTINQLQKHFQRAMRAELLRPLGAACRMSYPVRSSRARLHRPADRSSSLFQRAHRGARIVRELRRRRCDPHARDVSLMRFYDYACFV